MSKGKALSHKIKYMCMLAMVGVAVMRLNAASRKVVIPPGKWLADDGQTVLGPAEIDVPTPLSRLPHFVPKEENVK